MKKVSFPLARISMAVLLLALMVALSGCKTTRKPKWYEFWLRQEKPLLRPGTDIYLPPPAEIKTPGGPEEIATAAVDEPAGGLKEVRPGAATATVSELRTVYFDYNSFQLSQEAAQILQANAQWITAKEHSDVNIQVEGHCDERGSNEYNTNLGQKRAAAVREYLFRLGVDANRISTVSYGEERPIDPGHDEAAWARNRRAQFLVY
jgi:peptidoglycan-associated lipoprotein